MPTMDYSEANSLLETQIYKTLIRPVVTFRHLSDIDADIKGARNTEKV